MLAAHCRGSFWHLLNVRAERGLVNHVLLPLLSNAAASLEATSNASMKFYSLPIGSRLGSRLFSKLLFN